MERAWTPKSYGLNAIQIPALSFVVVLDVSNLLSFCLCVSFVKWGVIILAL